jgi:hypothetical protein
VRNPVARSLPLLLTVSFSLIDLAQVGATNGDGGDGRGGPQRQLRKYRPMKLKQGLKER